MSADTELFEKKSIDFENGQSAEMLRVKEPMAALEILNTLGVSKVQASILVCGSSTAFKPRIKNKLIDLLSRGVAQAALDNKAVIIDDGYKIGVSQIIGQGVADRGRETTLIGVLPKMILGGADEVSVVWI